MLNYDGANRGRILTIPEDSHEVTKYGKDSGSRVTGERSSRPPPLRFGDAFLIYFLLLDPRQSFQWPDELDAINASFCIASPRSCSRGAGWQA